MSTTKRVRRIITVFAIAMIFIMVFGTIAGALMGCGNTQTQTEQQSESDGAVTAQNSADAGTSVAETDAAKTDASEATTDETANAQASASESVEVTDDSKIRVASLKGPTTIGIVNLINSVKNGESDLNCEFEMYTAGSDIMAAMVAGKVDIGLVPSNVACVMNTKVEGGVSVIDINTLGVLYCVAFGDSVSSIKDLSGKTLYATGQGATPEYTIKYLLEANGVKDCNIEFKSEPTEIVSALGSDKEAVAIIPQPFVTAAIAQTEGLKIAFSLDDEWKAAKADGSIVTGVTVVTNAFLNEHKSLVDAFIKAHEESAKAAVSDVEGTAALVVEQGIIAKEPLAVKAIPNCNVVCIKGAEMKTALEGYLKVLFDQDPKSVGGSLPSEEFYYNN